MTQARNIEILGRDIIRALDNTFETRIKQFTYYSKDSYVSYREQFVNFIRHLEKRVSTIYFHLNTDKEKVLSISATTTNFYFKYSINPDKSSSFEIHYIQKTTRDFEVNFLKSRIHETSGYVYILKSEYGYKIGCSGKLTNRLNHFKILLPFKYTVHSVIKVKDFHRLEILLHTSLSHKRLNGEWFELEDSDFEEIDLILNNLHLKRIIEPKDYDENGEDKNG